MLEFRLLQVGIRAFDYFTIVLLYIFLFIEILIYDILFLIR